MQRSIVRQQMERLFELAQRVGRSVGREEALGPGSVAAARTFDVAAGFQAAGHLLKQLGVVAAARDELPTDLEAA